MKPLTELLENNRAWAKRMVQQDPDFFKRLSAQQAPRYLWIGCSDSRVPANQICGLPPGEIFVHRNVGNVVVHTDLNVLSVLQFAIDILKVKDVIVCGHYGCGGVRAAVEAQTLGLVDNWIRHIRDVADKYRSTLEPLKDPAREAKLCELNVKEQALNISRTSIVHDAWRRGHELSIHSWIYDIKDGMVRDLNFPDENT